MAYFRGSSTNMADCRKDREDTCKSSPASYSCDLTPTPSTAASATPAAESAGASSPATATASGTPAAKSEGASSPATATASGTPAAKSEGASSPATATASASGDSSPECTCPTKLAQVPRVLAECTECRRGVGCLYAADG